MSYAYLFKYIIIGDTGKVSKPPKIFFREIFFKRQNSCQIAYFSTSHFFFAFCMEAMEYVEFKCLKNLSIKYIIPLQVLENLAYFCNLLTKDFNPFMI